MSEHIRPPWTPEEVAGLNAWQHNGEVHPFTCGNDHDGDRVLVATPDGWVCPTCDYRQAWAHSFMAGGGPASVWVWPRGDTEPES